MSNAPRGTTTRDRHRNAIRRTKPQCGICEGGIDYALPHMDPKAFVVDHIIPLNKGGLDELGNKQAAHRDCNRVKWDSLPDDHAPRTFITSRVW